MIMKFYDEHTIDHGCLSTWVAVKQNWHMPIPLSSNLCLLHGKLHHLRTHPDSIKRSCQTMPTVSLLIFSKLFQKDAIFLHATHIMI